LSSSVHGDTGNLKTSHARALARLAERGGSSEHVVGAPLARDMLELSHELNRQIGVFVDRRGRVIRVILGDAHSLDLPEFERVRGADGRLRGVRLVLTHLVDDPLNREELADLAKLRLDMVCAIHLGAAGIQADLGALQPARNHGGFTVRIWDRAPLSHLAPDGVGNRDKDFVPRTDLPIPFVDFIRDLETSLVASTTRAHEQKNGTRAIILQVHSGHPDRDLDLRARQSELHELCRTAGVALVELVTQRRSKPDPRTFFGAGKLREVLIHALEQDVELLICDPSLQASQARVISEETDIKVIDRTMLILDIFAQHAKSSDGKLQVELAQLRYRLPRMVGKGTMMSRLAGGIGGRGPGESKLEIDRRRAQKRIGDLEKRLKNMRKQRVQRRSRRTQGRVPVVAIVGYTNAGKSTLLNTVTESTVVAENKLFATLDPTARRVRFPREHEIVMLDTVGFIRDLPPALMQAFSATLEEVASADLLLHIVDATDPDSDQQIQAVETILEELGARSIDRFMVYNKVDRLSDERRAEFADRPDTLYFISAIDRRSTRSLMEAVEAHLWVEPEISDLDA